VGPWYDGFWFLFSPLWAVALGWLATRAPLTDRVTLLDTTDTLAIVGYSAITQSHLTITIARSHLNGNVFTQHKFRFVVVPLVLLGLFLYSKWAFALGAVIGTWWDVYHSSLQTFGFGRIYDAKAGNDPETGRRLDYILNLFLYAGPVLAGAVLASHLKSFGDFAGLEPFSLGFAELDSVVFTSVPPYVLENRLLLRYGVITLAVMFFVVYVLAYMRHRGSGYRLPWQKAAIFGSTAICSAYAWGFNSFGMGFLIMNVFHAVQYYALVWWTERRNLGRVFRTGHEGWKGAVLLVGFLAVSAAFGLPLAFQSGHGAASVLLACALMHFWYDSFIWSVRKKEHLEVEAAPAAT
jgi:hypothetical protein